MRDLVLRHSFHDPATPRRCSIAEIMTTPNLPPRPTFGSSLRPIEASDSAGYGSPLDSDDGDHNLYWAYQTGWGDRFRALMWRGLLRLIWLALAAGLALGSAGIVAGAEHLPSAETRPELTWSADQAMSAKLDAAIRDLARLKDDVDSLGDAARKTLSTLTQQDELGLQTAWNDGWNHVTAIDASASDLTQRMQCGAWDAASQTEFAKEYSPPVVARYDKVCLAIGSVSPLHDDWNAMVGGSRTAIRVVEDIQTWNSMAVSARASAMQGRYEDALSQLGKAASSIEDATVVAGTLSNALDVSTLTKWLSRIEQMDDALRVLWQLMIDTGGAVTAEVTTALRAVNQANAQLPWTQGGSQITICQGGACTGLPNAPDPAFQNALRVVVYEMAGNLTSDGISIETARSQLGDALAVLTGPSVLSAP
jgi:hypothetical protein